jgi:hypothetical protein
MPLGKGVRYRYKKGTKIRLAFKDDEVIEAKNMESGETHTKEEFSQDKRRRAKRQKRRRNVI